MKAEGAKAIVAVATAALAGLVAAGCACESDIGLNGDEDTTVDTDPGPDGDDPLVDDPGWDPPPTDYWDTGWDTFGDPAPDSYYDPYLPEGMFGDIPPDTPQMYYAGRECYMDEHCLGVSYDAPVCLFDLDGHVMHRGYCSALCTESSSCHGEHTDCLGMFADGHAYCMALCATDGDCRGPNYYCLVDPLGQGILERFCVPSTWEG